MAKRAVQRLRKQRLRAPAKPEAAVQQGQINEGLGQQVQAAPEPSEPSPGMPEKGEEMPPFAIDLRPRLFTLPDIKYKTQIDIRYPLMPPYAFAHIYWDDEKKELMYDVEEYQLTDEELELLKLIQLGLEEMINISFAHATKSNVLIKYLEKNVQSILLELGAKVSRKSYLKIMYYLYRDFVGLNEIEPMLNDYYIEDIECNGVGSPVYIVHRRYQNLRTNISFQEPGKLVDFVEKLAQKTGRYVSFAKPLLDGTLPDGSRVNATYTSDVTTHGPTFTIRKFTREPLTPIHMMGYETANAELFAYFWLAVEHKFNIMIIGETASGKTTMLNAVLQFIPSEARIVSIEDTRELSIAHENWIPSVSRTGFGIPNLLGRQYGEVTLFDLLKETFRQNPDYVVVGEVRGKETYVLFQGMASIPGYEKVMVIKDGKPKMIEIEKIEDVENCFTVAFDKKACKPVVMPIAAHIRHPARKELMKIKTRTGREITCTPDHSLFTIEEGLMKEVAASKITPGSRLAVAARIPCGYADIKTINLLDVLPELRVYEPELVKESAHSLGYYDAGTVCQVSSITDYYSNIKKSNPASMVQDRFFNLMEEAGIDVNRKNLRVKMLRKSRPIRAEIAVSDDFLRLLGYYISEGSINSSGKNSSFSLYNKNPAVLQDMEDCIAQVTSITPRKRETHGFGTATELSVGNKIYADLLQTLCGRSKEKNIPDFIFGLSRERIGQFLSGMFTGDGYAVRKCIGYTTSNKEMALKLQQLLLVYGVVGRLKKGTTRQGRPIYEVVVYREQDKQELLKYIRLIGRRPFAGKKWLKEKNRHRDVYIDEVKQVEKVQLENAIPVYDLSVPGPENFLSASGIILHNSGHPSLSTFHAASVETVLRRLETPPINLPASLVDSLDIICSVIHIKDQKRNTRKVKDLKEIIQVKQALGIADTRTMFEWNPITDELSYNGNSYVLGLVCRKTGIPMAELERELKIRAELLRKMKEKGILNHEDFTRIVNQYYKDPEGVMKEYGISQKVTIRPEEVKEKVKALLPKEGIAARRKK